MLEQLFWILVAIIFYAYLGYTILLQFFNLFASKKLNSKLSDTELPLVTLLIAAYNEKDIIPKKIANSAELDYPTGKLKQLWITDGSDDGSEKLLENYSHIQVLHALERNGKTAALNRAMKYVSNPITVFCDANTMLSPFAIRKLVENFQTKNIGCVAGEKRIEISGKEKASAAGEGIYWNYESYIKKLESQFGSTLGAAGELFAIRTEFYTPPAPNIILDDFVVSLAIAKKGYKIAYEPEAYAIEASSFSIAEEMKRKIRIAAGSFQVLFGMPSLLNFFRHFTLSFQYLSHKVLRWIIVPFALPIVLILNCILAVKHPNIKLYLILLFSQLIIYVMVLIGSMLKEKAVRFKCVFYPYYLFMMNYSIILGLVRYLKGTQNAAWEKVKRQS